MTFESRFNLSGFKSNLSNSYATKKIYFYFMDPHGPCSGPNKLIMTFSAKIDFSGVFICVI